MYQDVGARTFWTVTRNKNMFCRYSVTSICLATNHFAQIIFFHNQLPHQNSQLID